MSPASTDIERARELLRAPSILVLTGAGISADSGVPTFRGPGGLWRDHRPEELATPEAFARDPRLVWEWYGWRRATIAACRPNAAHRALARWQARSGAVRIATQNVDGLHALARLEEPRHAESRTRRPADPGVPGLAELHGSIFRSRCPSCGTARENRQEIDASSIDALPACEECGGLLRPDVVWFGESLDPGVIGRAFEWAQAADVCLVVGTSAVVQPAASLAIVTRESGGSIVEVNPEATPLTAMAAVSIRSGAAAAVPGIVPA
jgi:NAD-dependent deacetylase